MIQHITVEYFKKIDDLLLTAAKKLQELPK